MIGGLSKKILRARIKLKRGLEAAVYKKWYWWMLRIALVVVVVKFIDAQRGPDFPTFISKIPIEFIAYPFLIMLLPLAVHYAESTPRYNRKIYDPQSPEIKAAARRWAISGWTSIGAAVATMAGGVALIGTGVPVPNWLLIGSFCVFLIVGMLSVTRAHDMRNGTWEPPEWMQPEDDVLNDEDPVPPENAPDNDR